MKAYSEEANKLIESLMQNINRDIRAIKKIVEDEEKRKRDEFIRSLIPERFYKLFGV